MNDTSKKVIDLEIEFIMEVQKVYNTHTAEIYKLVYVDHVEDIDILSSAYDKLRNNIFIVYNRIVNSIDYDNREIIEYIDYIYENITIPSLKLPRINYGNKYLYMINIEPIIFKVKKDNISYRYEIRSILDILKR